MKDIGIRAVKTFIQAFFGSLAITLPTTDLTNMALLKSILIGAFAMGISALMNFVLEYFKKESE